MNPLKIYLPALLCLFIFSPALADRDIDVVHYRFEVALNDASDTVAVKADIRLVQTKDALDTLRLDLDAYDKTGKGMIVKSLSIDEQQVGFIHEDELLYILLKDKYALSDTIELSLTYAGIPKDGMYISQNKYGERTFFSDHWPNRAHYWLAVVDDPADKASCEFVVTAPKHYKVVGSGNLIDQSTLVTGEVRHHWKENTPLSTKVMAVAAADFVTKPMESDHFSTSWVYRSTAQEGFKSFSDVMKIYNFFLSNLGEYPYSKLDHVESTTRFAGMENASNIFYDENQVGTGKEIIQLIAHEVAHQWFGNSVTEKSWEHVWLSEGFAEFLEGRYLEERKGMVRALEKYEADRIKIQKYEAKYPDRTVLIKSVDEPSKILSPLVYEKGAWILRMLRDRIGEEKMWEVLITYFQTYKHSNADTKDFIAVVEEVTGQNWDEFFYQWLEVPGGVDITYAVKRKGNKVIVTTVQHTDHVYDVRVDLQIKQGTSLDVRKLRLDRREQSFKIKVSSSQQGEFTLDPKGLIYGKIKG
ncbi:M1 family metallopeptidase [Reichenbachiella versicolor]|uniref:M1 family metallopeptidase n=1 Tax=Reichenbachiella versicolor TaxID=1821036 RepID=UPI000D6E999D|nr:M1 family metallopeptidase [Reichenbachiella versicolor]